MVKTYFSQGVSGGPIKIGLSTDPEKRVKVMQTGNPDELFLIGYIEGDLEKELHHYYADIRLNGEWFIATPELINNIKNRYLKEVLHDPIVCDDYVSVRAAKTRAKHEEDKREKRVAYELMVDALVANFHKVYWGDPPEGWDENRYWGWYSTAVKTIGYTNKGWDAMCDVLSLDPIIVYGIAKEFGWKTTRKRVPGLGRLKPALRVKVCPFHISARIRSMDLKRRNELARKLSKLKSLKKSDETLQEARK